MSNIPRLMLAAPSSGSGKTTITLGLIGAFIEKRMTVSSFKCGPDFVDPMFHRNIFGVKGYNLDMFLSSKNIIQSLLVDGSEKSDISVLEGVMGYYDGIGTSDNASSWNVAYETQTPTVLVVNCKGASLSICAVIKGMLQFRENSMVKGVILNWCSEKMFQLLKPIIESECNIAVYGYVPNNPFFQIDSRHLGLDIYLKPEEIKSKIDIIVNEIQNSIDIDGLIKLSQSAPDIKKNLCENTVKKCVDIAVAKDDAFCFYYKENLDLLERLGANLIFFSPIEDKFVPKADALYIGGGYPELFAQKLSENISMRDSIKKILESRIPVIAESGGFLYLHNKMEDIRGNSYSMVGFFDEMATKSNRLGNFGYIELESQKDSMLAGLGETIKAHEFHYWKSTNDGDSFKATKASGASSWYCIISNTNMYAGFPHLYFPGNPGIAKRFIEAGIKYKNKQGEN